MAPLTMPQRWRKLGRLLADPGGGSWLHSHAAVPIAQPLGGDRWRVLFTARDAQNRSHTGAAVVRFGPNGASDVSVEDQPLLSPGRLGAFDDSGAMASWLVPAGDRLYLYYIGWNRGVTVPFRNAIGLAVSDDGGATFVRYSEGPILDRSPHDPFFTASSCVLHEEGRWRMWYLSCVGWELHAGWPRHRYHIKYAESHDGIAWQRTGRVVIDFASAAEYAISRPCVLRDGDRYRMWYSYRGEAYRIGYAESDDGLVWRRLDERAGIEPGPDAWDAQMIEYPFVFDASFGRCLLYNGNDYGRTGIGIALLEDDDQTRT
jgi:hypothetical protein